MIRSDGTAPEQIRAFAFKDDRFSENISRAAHFSKFIFRAKGLEHPALTNELWPVVIDLSIEFRDLSNYRRTAKYEIRVDENMGRIRIFPGGEL